MIALLALTLAATVAEPSVRVSILESQHLDRVQVGGTEVVATDSGKVRFEGSLHGTFSTRVGHWRVEARALRRTYDGALSITSVHGRLKITLSAPLESYVAGVVAAESAPETPPAALEALAVVVRSYAVASRSSPLCDLASCQIFHGAITGREGDAARDAAAATAGLVLRLQDGTVAHAVFHASCGGHTAAPTEVFDGREQTGARAVADLDEPDQWSARVTASAWRVALRETFRDPLLSDEPVLIRGAGNRVIQLALSDGRRASAEVFVRTLDRSQGRGVVRSARFSVRHAGNEVLLSGTGHGHGVGLCQAGASLRAARGDAFEDILRSYFPVTTLGPIVPPSAG